MDGAGEKQARVRVGPGCWFRAAPLCRESVSQDWQPEPAVPVGLAQMRSTLDKSSEGGPRKSQLPRIPFLRPHPPVGASHVALSALPNPEDQSPMSRVIGQ
jgi:hypothetical protein